MALSSGTRLGPYEVLSALGAGGMGEVYRARDTRLGREVAIKVLPEAFADDAERLARFQREAQVLASLNHPNIGAIYGLEDTAAGRGAHACALVLELVEGPTLADRIARGPIPVNEALPIARQIAEALEAAHEHGIIHRDLKPANIKVTPDGVVKVLDFGLAKASNRATTTSAAVMESPTLSVHATQAGVILGTVAYMSPEQAAGAAADKRSDLWAFGVLLLEMLTGRQVFSGATVSHVLASVLRDQPDWSALPPDTPAAVRRLMRRCLEKDRRRRLADAADARLEIDDALRGDVQEPVVAPPRRLPRREQAAWALAAVLAAAALTLAVARLTATRPDVSVARFSIAPPDTSTFQSGGRGGWGSPVVMSPDGGNVVLVVVAPDGTQRLWIRALDASAPQPLAGTEGASSPFWSPDSRWIAFFADGKLKRIGAGGGDTRILCDSIGSGGGSWSSDDVILFAAAEAGEGGLVRVPGGGGTPVPVTTLDTSHGETNHLWPQFLPDGRHYLYVVGGRDNFGLYVGSVDSKDRTLLLDLEHLGREYSRVEYAAPGYLLFVRDGALLAQPFDATRLQITGDVIQVADGVLKEGPGSSAFSASANGVLAFWGGTVPPNIQLTWMRRDGTSAGTVGPSGPYSALSLSPDERTVAVSRFEPNEKVLQVALWLIDIQRSTATKFTFGTGSGSPAWSRDGAHIAYSSPRGGPPSLYQQSSDSVGADDLLYKSPVSSLPTDWSADGRTLVYQSLNSVTKWDLWLLPTAGARVPAPFLRTPFNETAARISPDGRWIAYVSDESGGEEVYVTSFPTARGKWSISTRGGNAPEWRHDGQELFYVAANRRLTAVAVNAAATFAAGAQETLSDVPSLPSTAFGESRSYAPAANGQRFLIGTLMSDTTVSPVTVVLGWTAAIRR